MNSLRAKNEFRDPIHLRYNKMLKGMPSQSSHNQNFNVTHVMNSKKGGFVTMRQNLIGFERNLLKITLNDVDIEPKLQKIGSEGLNGLTGYNARPDIRACGEWRQRQNTFLDICLTNINARSQKHIPVNTILKNTKKKKRELKIVDLRIWNMELSPY